LFTNFQKKIHEKDDEATLYITVDCGLAATEWLHEITNYVYQL